MAFTDAGRSLGSSYLVNTASSGYGTAAAFQNFTTFKTARGAKFVSVLVPTDGSGAAPAAAIASAGGSYTGAVEPNPADPDGSGSTPRLLTISSVFNFTSAQLDEVARNICAAAQGATPVADFGDAAALPQASSIRATTLRIGASVDAEFGAAVNADATGDDLHGADDEDGVTLPAYVAPGASGSMTVNVTNTSGATAYLNVWMDFNRNGSLSDAGEQVATNTTVATGTSNSNRTITFTAPASSSGMVLVRVRLTSVASPGTFGPAGNGEVEDHMLQVGLPSTDLAVYKTGPLTVAGSSALSYIIRVCNNGDITATNVVVQDPAVAGFSATSVTAEAGGGSGAYATAPASVTVAGLQGSGLVIPSLPAKSAVMFTVTGTSGVVGNVITSTASISSSTVTDPDMASNASTAVTRIVSLVGGRYSTYSVDPNATIAAAGATPANGGSVKVVFSLSSGLPVPGLGSSFSVPYTFSAMQSVTGQTHHWVLYGNNDGPPDRLMICPSTSGTNVGSLYRNLPPENSTTEGSSLFEISADSRFTTYLATGAIQPLGTVTTRLGALPSTESGIMLTEQQIQIFNNGAHTITTLSPFVSQGGFHFKPVAQPQVNAVIGGTSAPVMDLIPTSTYMHRYTAFSNGSDMPSNTNTRGTGITGSVTYWTPPDYGDHNALPSASSQVVDGLRIGAVVDVDPAMNANAEATGDDLNGIDDEDGVTLPASLIAGQSATVTVNVTNTTVATAYLNAWIDFNRNGSLADAGEQIATNTTVAVGTSGSNRTVNFTVPATSSIGMAAVRIRLTTVSSPGPDGADGNGEVEDYATAISPLGQTLSGVVFEDVNYGGGAGRNLAGSSGAGINGVRVELYRDHAGTFEFVSSATTNTVSGQAGSYSFTSLLAGSYRVRVVNNGTNRVPSSRSGDTASVFLTQTWRADVSSGSVVAVTGEIGGRTPSSTSDAANVTNAGAAFPAGALFWSPATIASSTVSGVDFGFNADVVVNANDSGIGSLRQVITNANVLSNSGLAQSGQAAGIENVLFNIPGVGPYTVSLSAVLPSVTAPLIINGFTQAGSSANTLATGSNAVIQIVLDGVSTATVSAGVTLDVGAAGSVVRGLSVVRCGTGIWVDAPNCTIDGVYAGLLPDGVTARPNGTGIKLGASSCTVGGSTMAARTVVSGNSFYGIFISSDNADSNFIAGCCIGTNAASTAARANGLSGIDIFSGDSNIIGGITAGVRNIISGNGHSGIAIGSSATANVIRGNYIGLAGDGNSAIPNSMRGIDLISSSTGNFIGDAVAGAGNVVSGNAMDGIRVQTTGNLIFGNIVGLNAAGTASVPNAYNGIELQAGGNTIGGATALHRNVVSGNSSSGIAVVSGTGNVVKGNYVGLNAAGTATLGNSMRGIYSITNQTLIGGAIDGEGNLVAGNSTGIYVATATAQGVRLSGNSIWANVGLGIDIGNVMGITPNDGIKNITAANSDMDYPVLTSTYVSGTDLLVSGYIGNNPAGSATFAGAVVELFVADNSPADQNGAVHLGDGRSEPHGEGRFFIGRFSAGALGTFSTTVPIPASAQPHIALNTRFTATATDDLGNTSEFGPTLGASDFGDAALAAASSEMRSDLRIGATIDTEPFTLGNAAATGDDLDGVDDEDGVSLPGSVGAGTASSMTVNVTNTTGATAFLNAWIDFNGNGLLTDAGEQVASNVVVANGSNSSNRTINFTVPASTTPGQYPVRVRLTSVASPRSDGNDGFGEVEDHLLLVGRDFGDAPSPYPTAYANTATPPLSLGPTVDFELSQLGDDGADEDGVHFVNQPVPGKTFYFNVHQKATGFSYTNIWVDWNRDGDFADVGEQVVTNSFHNGSSGFENTTRFYAVSVPATASVGATWMRFRIASTTGASHSDATSDGEVEDHPITIQDSINLGGMVWLDNNGDGQMNGSETALPAVRVDLLDSATSMVLESVLTDNSGAYSFITPPGSYMLAVVNPAAGTLTPSPLDVGPDATDCDFNPATGRTAVITLAPGATDQWDWDAGYTAPTGVKVVGYSRPLETTDINAALEVPKHDPAFGPLLSVNLVRQAVERRGYCVQHGGSGTANVNIVDNITRTYSLPNGSTITNPISADNQADTLAGVNALSRRVGQSPSGYSSINRYKMIALTEPYAGPLTDFTGSSGTTSVGLVVSADTNSSTGTGNSVISIRTVSQDGVIAIYSHASQDYGDYDGFALAGQLASSEVHMGINATDVDLPTAMNSSASADDTTGTDDDDLIMPVLSVGGTHTLDIPVTLSAPDLFMNTARLAAFVDWNGDGDILDAGEALPVVTVSASGNVSIYLNPPVGLSSGIRYMRLRLSEGNATPTFAGPSTLRGEVEDYALQIENKLAVGNLVFEDRNMNGIADPTEGVSDVVVQLYAEGDVPGIDLPTHQQTTVADGTYLFDDLAPGRWFVHVPASQFGETAPLRGLSSISGHSDGDDNVSEDGKDSAFPYLTGISSEVFDLQPGTQPHSGTGETGYRFDDDASRDEHVNLTIDFGFQRLVGIGNLVFVDANFDGVASASEGVNGINVELYDIMDVPGVDAPMKTTITSNGGRYSFPGLFPGVYRVHLPANEFQAGTPLHGLVSLVEGISGDDDAGEDGLNDSTPSVEGVSSGVVFVSPGAAPTAESGETGIGSEEDDPMDASVDLTIDFGFQIPMGIGNLVFIDANQNGRFDTGEGVEGVEVELYSGTSVPGYNLAASRVWTDAYGRYLFDRVPSGNWFVHIPATNFQSDGPLQGLVSVPGQDAEEDADDSISENGLDSPSPEYTGISSALIAIAPGAQPQDSSSEASVGENGFEYAADSPNDSHFDLTIDFGFAPPDLNAVGVGNLVYEDKDGNGVADSGEGVAGVTVELFAADASGNPSGSALASTVTSSGGFYYFGGVTEGDYLVRLPAANFTFNGSLKGRRVLSPAGQDDGLDDNHDQNGEPSAQPETAGVWSSLFHLAPGTEPVDEGNENGQGAYMDASLDANVDLTIDFGFYSPVAVGNLVFVDANENGVADAGEGIGDVEVQLFKAGDNPSFTAPLATQTTSVSVETQGRFLFTELKPGYYFLHLPATEFQLGQTLHDHTLLSASGAEGDDNLGQNGISVGDPEFYGVSTASFALLPGRAPVGNTLEGGLYGTDDDANSGFVDANVDLTRDFGFLPVTEEPPLTFAQWQAQNVGQTATAATDDLDRDGMSNLLEHALGLDALGASAGMARFRVERNAAGDAEAVLVRSVALPADVRYVLQGAVFGGSWTTLSATPSVSFPGNGTQVARYAALEDHSFFSAAQAGRVRLLVELDADLDGTAEASVSSTVHAFAKRTLPVGRTTFGQPLLAPAILTGQSDGLDGSRLVMVGATGSHGIDAALSSGVEYYVQVMEGSLAGHRFEVDEALCTASGVALIPNAPRNTLSGLPVGLAGVKIALRPHWTVSELLPVSSFSAGASSAVADNVLAYENGDFVALWAGSSEVGNQWLTGTNPGSTPAGARVVPFGEGLMVHARAAAVNVIVAGEENSVAAIVRLKSGSTLLGGISMSAQSAQSLNMISANGFITGDAESADRLRLWQGDENPTLSDYDGYFYDTTGSWLLEGDVTQASHNLTPLMQPWRAVFTVTSGERLVIFQP